MYFEDRFLWEKCQFEDLTKEEFEYGVEKYWKRVYPIWFRISFLMEKEQLMIIKFINCKAVFNLYPLDYSVLSGKLDVVKWTFYNTNEDYSTNAMDWAIENGYLDIFEWLYKNTIKGCSSNSIDNIIRQNDFKKVKILSDHHMLKYSIYVIMDSIDNNKLDMIKFLYKHDKNNFKHMFNEIGYNCLYEWKPLAVRRWFHKHNIKHHSKPFTESDKANLFKLFGL